MACWLHFQGSNDGTNWTTLHTVSGYASGWTTKQTFEFDNDTAYTHYRVYFNESTSGTYVWLMEIEMLARGANQNATFAVAGEAAAWIPQTRPICRRTSCSSSPMAKLRLGSTSR